MSVRVYTIHAVAAPRVVYTRWFSGQRAGLVFCLSGQVGNLSYGRCRKVLRRDITGLAQRSLALNHTTTPPAPSNSDGPADLPRSAGENDIGATG